MSIADRIQQLRKEKGISQEELADQIGVSRQAVSKWESGQSMPDIEKILLLGDFFGTTTDYLLKGTEPVKEADSRWNAMVFTMAGTIINAIGLVVTVIIWTERQTYYATGVGIVMMLFGTGVFLSGQIVDSTGKAKARDYFALPNVWILLFIPMSLCFNFLNGLRGGGFGLPAPVPMLVNSIRTFALYWVVYIAVCVVVDLMVHRGRTGK
ncbi:MAG: helix-turn-helix domain-containing protein [Lachnospiraceae bacterium]|nr:helix-turn-helix domain-containing protein [Lachnospiraceae bacterium]